MDQVEEGRQILFRFNLIIYSETNKNIEYEDDI